MIERRVDRLIRHAARRHLGGVENIKNTLDYFRDKLHVFNFAERIGEFDEVIDNLNSQMSKPKIDPDNHRDVITLKEQIEDKPLPSLVKLAYASRDNRLSEKKEWILIVRLRKHLSR